MVKFFKLGVSFKMGIRDAQEISHLISHISSLFLELEEIILKLFFIFCLSKSQR